MGDQPTVSDSGRQAGELVHHWLSAHYRDMKPHGASRIQSEVCFLQRVDLDGDGRNDDAVGIAYAAYSHQAARGGCVPGTVERVAPLIFLIRNNERGSNQLRVLDKEGHPLSRDAFEAGLVRECPGGVSGSGPWAYVGEIDSQKPGLEIGIRRLIVAGSRPSETEAAHRVGNRVILNVREVFGN